MKCPKCNGQVIINPHSPVFNYYSRYGYGTVMRAHTLCCGAILDVVPHVSIKYELRVSHNQEEDSWGNQ